MTSGSQKRKTTAQIKVNCTPEQKAAIIGKATAAGYSPAAICLNVLLKSPLPPRSRVTADVVLLARVLAELGKIGSNVNQIAYHLNAGRPGDRIEGRLDETLRELLEWRTAVMHAIGAERNRKPKDK